MQMGGGAPVLSHAFCRGYCDTTAFVECSAFLAAGATLLRVAQCSSDGVGAGRRVRSCQPAVRCGLGMLNWPQTHTLRRISLDSENDSHHRERFVVRRDCHWTEGVRLNRLTIPWLFWTGWVCFNTIAIALLPCCLSLNEWFHSSGTVIIYTLTSRVAWMLIVAWSCYYAVKLALLPWGLFCLLKRTTTR